MLSFFVTPSSAQVLFRALDSGITLVGLETLLWVCGYRNQVSFMQWKSALFAKLFVLKCSIFVVYWFLLGEHQRLLRNYFLILRLHSFSYLRSFLELKIKALQAACTTNTLTLYPSLQHSILAFQTTFNRELVRNGFVSWDTLGLESLPGNFFYPLAFILLRYSPNKEKESW